MRGEADFGAVRAWDPIEIRHDAAALDEPGFWVVVCTFEGALTAVRMGRTSARRPEPEAAFVAADVVDTSAWSSSLDAAGYEQAVEDVRRRVARGEVYQANICRVMQREIPDGFPMQRLAQLLEQGNPAPYAARIEIPDAGLDIVCASPELYLSRQDSRLVSMPIKGTAPTVAQLLPKDTTENVMITDLVRNDLSPVSRPGSVAVEGLCLPQEHPGLVHLVSTVSSQLRDDVTWAAILGASFPPGSVSGAPKSTALQAITELERVPRGPYCGAIGFVDNDPDGRSCHAELAVGIRTFWAEREAGRRLLRFGTGAGITWGSDPEGEWAETELKARRLISLADRALNS
ncbi:chorismate-binding protein [Calidifontibacter terrae]